MSLTKEIHTHIVKTTLDFCDKEKIEFRDFLSERLLDEDDSYEWDGSMWTSPGLSQHALSPFLSDFWKYLQFYYDQSENAVTPKTDQWSQEDWNLAANEIYRHKFLNSAARAEEWVAHYNSSLTPQMAAEKDESFGKARDVYLGKGKPVPISVSKRPSPSPSDSDSYWRALAAAAANAATAEARASAAEARASSAEARASSAETRALDAEARAHAAEARALDAEVNTRSLLRCEDAWHSTRSALIEEVLCDLHAIGQSSK
jgi:hypothetical protein